MGAFYHKYWRDAKAEVEFRRTVDLGMSNYRMWGTLVETCLLGPGLNLLWRAIGPHLWPSHHATLRSR